MVKFLIALLVLLPLLSSFIVYIVGEKKPSLREILAIAISGIELIGAILLTIFYKNYDNELVITTFTFKADGFRSIYALISIFMWFITICFSKQYMQHYDHKSRYYLFYLITLAGVVGVFLSNDLFTTFIFFEMMSFASYVLVIHDQKDITMRAGATYLVIAIISGMILLMGLFMLYGEIGSLDIETIKNACEGGISKNIYIAGILLLIGFGAKAGMFPLHIWLPKAHPVAPAPASALLSGILTKCGVFGIIVICVNIFENTPSFGYLLLILAIITMVLGAVLAIFSVNLKRTIACSSMSQIGFILVGLSMMVLLGEENALASQGAFLHMVNHSLIKLVLFIIAGVVVCNIHKLDLNDVKGFGRKKPLIMICFAIASIGIMGIPLLNGYVSKTLLHESIVEYTLLQTGSTYVLMKAVEWSFLISGGFTIAYMLKIFVCLFIEKNDDEKIQAEYDSQKNYLTVLSKIVIVASTAILPVLGILPNIVNDNLARMAASFFGNEEFKTIQYFSLENLKGALISLLIGLFTYFVIIRLVFIRKGKYVNLWNEKIDLETLIYVPVLKGLLFVACVIVRAISEIIDTIIYVSTKYIFRQYYYQFEAYNFSYKVGAFIDKLYNKRDHHFALSFYKSGSEAKHINNAIKATFSFSLLMASIGIVVVLLVMLVKG